MAAPRQLTLCEYNVENLFLSMTYYDGQDLEQLTDKEWKAIALAQMRYRQKPLRQLWGVAKAIQDIDADIYLLVEVGGEESLTLFNRHFLGDRYDTYFVEGNARRGIDLGFLVRKNLGLRVEARSNKEAPVEVATRHGTIVSKFSRDVAELRLHDENDFKLILLLVHLKSKLSTEDDFQGKDARAAEASALAGIYQNLRQALPDAPIVVGGDFNADFSSLELELLKRTDLEDFHDVLNTPREERTTYVHFDYGGTPNHLVLDYLLVSPHLKDRIISEKSRTHRYKGLYDITEDLPKSLKERYRQPSDHFPVVLTIRL